MGSRCCRPPHQCLCGGGSGHVGTWICAGVGRGGAAVSALIGEAGVLPVQDGTQPCMSNDAGLGAGGVARGCRCPHWLVREALMPGAPTAVDTRARTGRLAALAGRCAGQGRAADRVRDMAPHQNQQCIPVKVRVLSSNGNISNQPVRWPVSFGFICIGSSTARWRGIVWQRVWQPPRERPISLFKE